MKRIRETIAIALLGLCCLALWLVPPPRALASPEGVATRAEVVSVDNSLLEEHDVLKFGFEGYGHSIAVAGPYSVDDLLWFCHHYVYNKEKLQVDGTYRNLDPATMPPYDLYKPSDLYK